MESSSTCQGALQGADVILIIAKGEITRTMHGCGLNISTCFCANATGFNSFFSCKITTRNVHK